MRIGQGVRTGLGHGASPVSCRHNFLVSLVMLQLFNYQKAEDKIFFYKFSKNIKSKLYHIENSKTRGQTV